MTYTDFTATVQNLFDAVKSEATEDWTFDEWFEMAHETIDSCAEVIYTANAWDLVSSIRANCFTLFTDAEQALDDLGMEFDDIDKHMTAMAYQILMIQVMGMVEASVYPEEA